ncbi:MAG TPA: GntR family transcriptional regulator [Polyangiaceae bacterium]
MPLHAVESASLGDLVFKQLSAEIISGRYAQGSWLPAERALTEVFRVNRHVVREALKRLAQVGLVKVSPGGGTQVIDFKQHAGLDLLVPLAEYTRSGGDTTATWFSVLEMRAALAADAVRLCTRRAPPALKTELLEITKQMSATLDGSRLFALELRFWDSILTGAENIAYRLAFNTMLKGTRAMAQSGKSWIIAEAKRRSARVAIAEAILAGDEERAHAVATHALREALEQALPSGTRSSARALTTKSAAKTKRSKNAPRSPSR